MTRSRESLPLRETPAAEADALARAVRVALDADPSSERLASARERLLSAVDTQAAPRIGADSGLSVVRSVWWIGMGVLALALLEFVPRPSAPQSAKPAAGDRVRARHARVVEPQVVPVSVDPVIAPRLDELRAGAERTRAASRKSSRADDPPPSAAPKLSELELLRAAQHALPAAPAEALLRLQEHRAAYPHGLLEQEREVLVIEAALAMHQTSRALQLAHAFAVAFPRSAHLRRLQRMLAQVGKTFSPDGNTSDSEPLMKGNATTESQDHGQE